MRSADYANQRSLQTLIAAAPLGMNGWAEASDVHSRSQPTFVSQFLSVGVPSCPRALLSNCCQVALVAPSSRSARSGSPHHRQANRVTTLVMQVGNTLSGHETFMTHACQTTV